MVATFLQTYREHVHLIFPRRVVDKDSDDALDWTEAALPRHEQESRIHPIRIYSPFSLLYFCV